MEDELKGINKFRTENKNKLPLVLQDIEVRRKQTESSGKLIQIEKYRTRVYPIDNYYKYISRIIE